MKMCFFTTAVITAIVSSAGSCFCSDIHTDGGDIISTKEDNGIGSIVEEDNNDIISTKEDNDDIVSIVEENNNNIMSISPNDNNGTTSTEKSGGIVSTKEDGGTTSIEMDSNGNPMYITKYSSGVITTLKGKSNKDGKFEASEKTCVYPDGTTDTRNGEFYPEDSTTNKHLIKNGTHTVTNSRGEIMFKGTCTNGELKGEGLYIPIFLKDKVIFLVGKISAPEKGSPSIDEGINVKIDRHNSMITIKMGSFTKNKFPQELKDGLIIIKSPQRITVEEVQEAKSLKRKNVNNNAALDNLLKTCPNFVVQQFNHDQKTKNTIITYLFSSQNSKSIDQPDILSLFTSGQCKLFEPSTQDSENHQTNSSIGSPDFPPGLSFRPSDTLTVPNNLLNNQGNRNFTLNTAAQNFIPPSLRNNQGFPNYLSDLTPPSSFFAPPSSFFAPPGSFFAPPGSFFAPPSSFFAPPSFSLLPGFPPLPDFPSAPSHSLFTPPSFLPPPPSHP
ncbi:MAG: hypothetical protein LBG13_00760 [Holosporales bacterium]|jgi:hypothetical protein|nr:hypothetical protein [Holosporales bacterium]